MLWLLVAVLFQPALNVVCNELQHIEILLQNILFYLHLRGQYVE